MNIDVKLQIRHGWKLLNLILIVILSIGVIFIGCIEYLRIQDGENKEVVTDWDYPHITWSGEEILSIPFVIGIGLLISNKKKKIIDAKIEINKDSIVVKYLNKIFTMKVKNIKTIKYSFDEKNKLHLLMFRGTEKMLEKKGNRHSNNFDLIIKEDINKLCNNITSITNLKIKNFDNLK